MLVRLLTANDLAERLRVSKYHAYELMRRNVIPSVRIGRLRRIREQDLESFIVRGDRQRRWRERVANR
jgi:excisionase family DNA binding protein